MGLKELITAEHRDIFRGWFFASALITVGLIAFGVTGVQWMQTFLAWVTYGTPALAMTALSGYVFFLSDKSKAKRDEWQ